MLFYCASMNRRARAAAAGSSSVVHVAASGRPPFTSLGLVRVAVIGMAAARSQLPRRRTRTALSATQPSVQDPSGTAGAVTCARSNFPSLSTIAIEITGWRVFCVYPGAVAGKAHVANGDNVGAPVHRYRGGVLHAWWRQRRRGCVLRAACCVLRAACCVLRAACCVLLCAAAGCCWVLLLLATRACAVVARG
jgi:hypothetical protein